SVDGCARVSFAKNMCAKHYQKAQHPLKATWKIIRSRHKGEYPDRWDTFENFLFDVGERPTPRHQLRRDESRPWSKENFVWREPIGSTKHFSVEEKVEYARRWQLRKKYNLSLEEYFALNTAQAGLCAICHKPEKRPHPKTRVVTGLVVDHCHRT